ncbi:hypothetical protein [Deinococcus hopiensis]|uniref:Uncharacterized protein n=1 Tax=Deinococcus hopiensis KR-140 TaxID=695939 RepID=A0A1W1VBP9_9DEIO|nr:hypothetical protein [Deinococcus hopiensis]SMB90788.1 hypothetical protein SAMN00790413_00893 [Deinococcus hopiensis KR-140]
MKRLLLALVLPACAVGPAAAAPPARVVADPWPRSPVLLRLYALPASARDRERLTRALNLAPAEVAELRRLARSEAADSEAGRHVLGRQEATQLNVRIAAHRAEKDRKVRALLGGRYPAFRAWVRLWWASQVKAAR